MLYRVPPTRASIELLPSSFAPGQTVDAIFGLPRDLTDDEASMIGQYLVDNGLNLKSIELGATPDWQYAMRLRFKKPHMSEGYAVIPLIPLIGVLGVLGIGGFLGWRVVSSVEGGIESFFAALTKNLIPIVLITGGVVIVGVYLVAKR